MLTAFDKKTKQRINPEDFKSLEENLTAFELVDPYLGMPVTYVRSHFRKNSFVTAHFRIKNQNSYIEIDKFNSLWDDDLFKKDEKGEKIYINESIEHIMGKAKIAQYFSENCNPYNHKLTFRYEYRLTIPHKNKTRIADVAVFLGDKIYTILECQLSRITPQHIQERIDDYLALGLTSQWFLGVNCNTSMVCDILYQNFGEVPPLIKFVRY
jgi:hypothetical protein